MNRREVLTNQLKNFLNSRGPISDEFLLRFRKSGMATDILRDVLEEHLRDREKRRLIDLLISLPGVLRILRNELTSIPADNVAVVIDAAMDQGADLDDEMAELYLKNREDVDQGPLFAIYLLELEHPGAVDALLDQLNMDVDHATDLAWSMQMYFAGDEKLKKSFFDSDDPRIRYIQSKYEDILATYFEEIPTPDKFEFIKLSELKITNEWAKTALYRIANGLGNVILEIKQENEIPFVSYDGIPLLLRLLLKSTMDLILQEEFKEILLQPDEPAQHLMAKDLGTINYPEMFAIYRETLDSRFDQEELYNVDYLNWRLAVRFLEIICGGNKKEDERISEFVLRLSWDLIDIMDEILEENEDWLPQLKTHLLGKELF
jgi:hypothetical protein